MAAKKKPTSEVVKQMIEIISNQQISHTDRIQSLSSWANADDESTKEAAELAFKKLVTESDPDAKTVKLNEQLEALITDLMSGPQKEGSYLGSVMSLSGKSRALIEVDGGDRGYLMVPDQQLADSLRVGDTVMISVKGGTVTGMGYNDSVTGEEVQFTRRIDEERVEIRTRGDDKRIVRLSHDVREAVIDGVVKPGANLILNRAGTLARQFVVPMDGFAHYRFLERVPVPDVRVDRDIGAPPKCIEEIADTLRLELVNPDVRRKYKMRRCIMKLLAGVSGSGKTLAIQAIWRQMYEVMEEVTGIKLEDLPPRVFWLRPGRLLSKWFGESEQLIEQAMDEVQALADEKFTTTNGKEIQLPVLVVMEEIDGIARARGGNDQIYDRVLTTLLQRLDPSQPALQQRLIVFLGTTNEPGQVDRAFLRRIGGTVEQFGRLERKGFMLVLDKHLRDLPLSGNASQSILRKRFGDRLADWIFNTEADPGLVNITIGGKEARCHRSDFLTGGLIDRAVQQGATSASDAEAQGQGDGVTLQGLAEAIESQLRMIADQLTAENIGRYMTLPDGMRVTKLTKIPAEPLPVLQQ